MRKQHNTLFKIFIAIILCFLLLSQILIVISAPDTTNFDSNNNSFKNNSTRENGANNGQKKWTVMIYMAADNNLEYYGVADLNELELVGSSDEVNIVVQFDRNPGSTVQSGYSASNGDWTDTRRFYVEQDNDNVNFYDYTEDVNMWVLGEKNMAAEQTFREFMDWTLGNYSADHYLLVMWNHGEGIFSVGRGGRGDSAGASESQEPSRTRGVCNDETNGGWLHLWEMKNVFEEMKSKYSATIDIVAFDVCWIGGSLETAYEFVPYADYLAGSQEEEPNPGWNYYRPIGTLVDNPDIAPKDLAIKIAEDFKEEYKVEEYTEDKYITFVAIDLDRFYTHLVPLINNFADTMAETIYDNYIIINNARKNTDVPRRSGKSYMRDFFHFVELIYQDPGVTTELKVIACEILDEYNQTTLTFVHGSLHPDAHGLYIYFPDNNYRAEYSSNIMFSNERWDEFLKLFITPIQIEFTPLNDTEDKSGEFEVTAIIKGFKLDETNIYVFYNDSETDIVTPVQMVRIGAENEHKFSAKMITTNYETRIYYYIRAADNTGGFVMSPQNLDLSDPSTWYSFHVGVDKTPPVIIHDPIKDVQADVFGEPYVFYANISDNLGLDPKSLFLYYNTNNSDWYTEVPLNVAYSPENYYCFLPAQEVNTIIYYHFRASDLAGIPNLCKEPKVDNFEFNVSRTKPKAAFELSKYQAHTYEQINFTSISQPEKLIETYSWDFGDNSKFGDQKNETHEYTEPNIYTITLKVIDVNGLWDTESVQIVITNSPPVAKIDYGSVLVNNELRTVEDYTIVGSVYEDDEVFVDCSLSIDKDGYIKEWTWDFGDGNEYTEIIEDTNQDGQFTPGLDKVIPMTKMSILDQEERLNSSKDGRLSYNYTDAGNYTITFTIKDNADTLSDVQILKVNVENRPPTPYPAFRVRGLKVEFVVNKNEYDIVDSPSDYQSLNYTWDFGDGEVDYSPNTNHTFSKRDKYTVTLIVMDDDGAIAVEKLEVDLRESEDNSVLIFGMVSIAVLIIIFAILLFVIKRNRSRTSISKGQLEEVKPYEPMGGRAQPGPTQWRATSKQGQLQIPPQSRFQTQRTSESRATGSQSISKDVSRRSYQRPREPSAEDGNGRVKVSDILSKIQK